MATRSTHPRGAGWRAHGEFTDDTAPPYGTGSERRRWIGPQSRGQYTFVRWRVLARTFASISRVVAPNGLHSGDRLRARVGRRR